MPIGLVRNKTHTQALTKPTWSQERFDGGLDIDLPGTKIASNEMAVLENIVAYEKYMEGGSGRKLYTTTAMPGSGVFHGWLQHPKHKRILLYRGTQVWLSSDETMVAWSQVTSPGPNGGETVSATVDDGSGPVVVNFTLRGLTAANTDGYKLWWKVVSGSGNLTFTLYKDSAMTQSVALGEIAHTETTNILEPDSLSGISGSNSWAGASLSPGTYAADDPLQFSPTYQNGEVLIGDGYVKIEVFGDNFVLFIRDAADSLNRTAFVDVSQLQYWMLSTKEGYGAAPLVGGTPGATYQFRYLYTFSRIVDPSTGNPVGLGHDRISDTLQFEGPSNALNPDTSDQNRVDYSSYSFVNPTPSDEPISLYGTDGSRVAARAANYITHISMYRTLDIGANGIDPNTGVGNNSEIYVWIGDLPIWVTIFFDSISDETLRYRYAAGFGLHTRFFTEMQRGIGSIGPDFMYTSSPLSQRVDYCPLNVSTYVGYFNAALQYFNTKDIVEQIIRTRTTFVIMCRSLTMTSVSQIYQDAGSTEFIPVIQDYQPASDSLGITSFNSYCRLDDSTFAALCSDNTIRIFASGRWGDPLDSDKVHREIILAKSGASLGFVRGALCVFYNTTEVDEGTLLKCLRYGFGGLSGFRWSTIARPNWIHPHIGLNCLIMEDVNEVRRLLQIDDEANACFSFEDPEGIRVWKDDTVTSDAIFSGATASRWTDLQITGFSGETLYGTYAGGGNHSITFYATASDRDNFINPILFGNLTALAGTVTLVEQSGSGVSGSVVFNGDLSGPDGDLNVSFSGAGTSEIPCRWRPKELIGGLINYTLFHEESHLSILPVSDTLPAGFAIAAQGYANGVAVPGAYIPAAAYNGAIAYQANLEGTRIQNEFTTTTSKFRIASMNTQYQAHDMKSTTGPQSTTESAYQKEIAGPFDVWLSHYTTPFYRNRAGGKKMGAPDGTPDLVTDPTGRSWAMQMFNTSPEVVATPLTQTRSVSTRSFLWYMSGWATPDVNLFSVLTGAAETFYIRFNVAGNLDINGQTFDMSAYAPGTWRCFAVVIDVAEVRLYIDGVMVATFAVTMSPATGDNLVIGADVMGAGDTGAIIFDPRWFTNALSAGAINYYVRDITLNEGRKVLP